MVNKTTKEQIEIEKRQYGISEDRFNESKKSMVNLKRIVVIYLAVNLFSMSFALISFLWARYLSNNEGARKTHNNCNVITGVPSIDAYFWLLYFSVNQIMWQIPFLRLFTPLQMRDCCKKRRNES